MIDLCIIATLRSRILRQTLKSFCKNLLKRQVDLNNVIVNIDPIGENESSQKVLDTAQEFFNISFCRMAKTANFAKAVKYVWSKTNSKYVFHLEDDWLLLHKLNFESMLSILENNSNMACLRLSKYDLPKREKIRLFNSDYYYNNNFFLASDSLTQFGLNPCIIRKEFIDQALPLMSDFINPEKQFRPKKPLEKIVRKWKFAIYGQPGWDRTIQDIGRNWIKNHHFQKPKNSTFLKWDKI